MSSRRDSHWTDKLTRAHLVAIIKMKEDHYEAVDGWGYAEGCACGANWDDAHEDEVRRLALEGIAHE